MSDKPNLQIEENYKAKLHKAIEAVNSARPKYHNQFHKESSERKMKEIEEWHKQNQPFDVEKAIETMRRNLVEANRLYPD